ncbi:MAG: Hpt domain-containing protein [Gammaproteobacteria bacterium]|nr:Hpt domain-containing protein [Gammaproteobacteria bacterium]
MHEDNTTTPPLFDLENLKQRVMGNEALLQQLLQLFLSDMPRQIELLKSAVAAEDIPLATAHAHKIKGGAANIGAVPMSLLAKEIEFSGKEGDLEQMQQQVPQLETLFSELKTVMEKVRQ